MAQASHDRENNFDAIRILGAFLVLVGHAYPLHGRDDFPRMWNTSFATLGIMLFFSISGYLIATSWTRDPRLAPYLAKRALRIFPALAVVIFASVLFLGPLFTTLAKSEYLTSPGTWSYLTNVLLKPQYTLPGVFEGVPYAGVVNGSLWSLPLEFACYLMVPVVSLLSTRLRGYGYAGLAVLFAVAASILASLEIDFVFYGSSLVQALGIWPFFMVGAAVATAGARLPLRLDFAVIAIVCASLVTGVSPDIARYFWLFALPYVAITFGKARTPVVARAGRFGDVSYGIYLFAFPVQQLVIALVPNLSFVGSIGVTVALTVCCAFVSWHVVEKQALKFKPSGSIRPKPGSVEKLR